jgi:tetratricopeptide (TPR) repeat protein
VARPRKHWPMVEASRDEASLAVRLYNDPAEVRSFEGFVVHVHLAWLYLLHAELTRDNIDYRYWRQDNPRLLEKVDGEPKRWELAKCVKERWPDEKHPVRANLDFFIGLRNRVEHRYARQQQALAAVVGGQAQALLLNYEEELVAQFGPAASLATRLRFPVFVGSFTDEGERTLRRLRGSLPASLRRFISDYHANLEPSTSDDPRFELRLRVLQELAPNVDLWRFQAGLQQAAQSTDTRQQTELLRAVTENYPGAFAAEADYLWVNPVRDAIHRRALDAHVELARLWQQADQLDPALATMERAIELDPYAEDLYGWLMELQHKAGRDESVRLTWKQLSARLDEIDAEPEAATQRLYRDNRA